MGLDGGQDLAGVRLACKRTLYHHFRYADPFRRHTIRGEWSGHAFRPRAPNHSASQNLGNKPSTLHKHLLL